MTVRSLLDTPGEYIEKMGLVCSQSFMHYKTKEKNYKSPLTEESWVNKQMCERIVKWGNAQVSVPLSSFVQTQLTNSEKSIILWSFAFVDIFRRVNHLVTFDDLTAFFPFGFPGKEGIDYMWWQQHVDGVDLLNDPVTWEHQSFCFPLIELENAEVVVT